MAEKVITSESPLLFSMHSQGTMGEHVYIMKLTHDHRKPYNITTSIFMSWQFPEELFEQNWVKQGSPHAMA